MKSIKVVVAALCITSIGTAFAAETDPVREQQMQQRKEQIQERVGANGEKYHQLMEQKREQFKNQYHYQNRNQIMDGSGARMQERMMNRNH